MLRIALRTLRTRRLSFVGAFVATALAVALVACWGILMQSALQSTPPVHRLGGTPIVVTGHQKLSIHYGHGDDREGTAEYVPERARVPLSLVDKVRNAPGVTAAVADVSFPATVDGQPVTGHGWDSARLTPTHLSAGRPPVGPAEIAAARPVGDIIHLRGPTGTRDYTVTGTVPRGAGVFVSNATAPTVAGHPGTADLVGAFPASAETAVAKAIGDAGVVRTGTDRGQAEHIEDNQGINDLVGISGAIGGIVIAVAVFVVAATLSVSVQQRSREIALLRAVAATPWQVRRMVACEGLGLAIVSALVGAAPGILLARLLRAAMVHKGVIPDSLRLHVGWIPFLVAGGAALIVVQGASLVSGMRAARVRPTAALQESLAQPRRLSIFRLLLGIAALGGGIALLTVSMSLQGDSAAATAAGVGMIFIVAIGLLGPLIATVGVILLGAPMRRLSRVGGFLAAVNARSRSRRLASAVTPVALCVAMAFITVFLQSTITHAEKQQSRDRLVANRIVNVPGPGAPKSTVDALAGKSGVDSAVGLIPTQALLTHDLEAFPAQVVTTGRIDRVLDLDVQQGRLRSLGPDEIAVSRDAADLLHAHVGRKATFWLGDGQQVHPRVAAIYRRGLGFGDVLLPWAAASTHVTNPAAATILVRGDVDGRTLTQAVPGGQVTDRQGYRAQEDKEQKVNAWLNYVLLGLIVAYAAIAMANTLVMTVSERRREFALTRLVGATARQVLRTIRWEAVLVVIVGITVGAAAGLAALVPFSRGVTGSVSGMYVAPLPAVVIAGSTAVLALVATILPTRAALRQRPIEAVGTRD